MKVLAFSRNMAYGVGGAEKSLLSKLELDNKVDSYTLLSAEVDQYSDKEFCYKSVKPHYIDKIHANLINRFFFTEYLINKKVIAQEVESRSSEYDELWAQNLWAPQAILSFKGITRYYIRDEFNLNCLPNYHFGVKRLAKKFYDAVDYLGFRRFCSDNIAAMLKADEVVANSNYMAERISSLVDRPITVEYPEIDLIALKKSYKCVAGSKLVKGVVMVGDNYLKGFHVAMKLAARYPETPFYIFGRSFVQDKVVGNIHFKRWVAEPGEIYKYAKVTIMPSIWDEAYGRVAAESIALGIPCVVSNRGGLPEAVGYNSCLIAKNFEDFSLKLGAML